MERNDIAHMRKRRDRILIILLEVARGDEVSNLVSVLWP